MASVRTRFAPSPTGFLHLGGARTALFAWAFARHHQGTFILRIEDTDVERSTPAAIDAILHGMAWLGLDYDEGPFYQMQRMDRYRAVIADMLARGLAYHCYMQPAELDALRAEQMARGEKPRYDGRWRPENAQGRSPPQGVAPVVRFRNPDDGVVAWDDAVKGVIEYANAELDDLVIARSDGTPTYNFCVVVDDLDMRISHVIRGDDHVNNTPRQINILRALGATLPVYAHLPTVLGEDGTKLSKRHGAVSVTEYESEGFLPEAVINALARIGWSHGDVEVFSRDELVEWFGLEAIHPSPSRFDLAKLRWFNHEHMKRAPVETLGRELEPFLRRAGLDPATRPACRRGRRAAARSGHDVRGGGRCGALFLCDPTSGAGEACRVRQRRQSRGARSAGRGFRGRRVEARVDRRRDQAQRDQARIEAAAGDDAAADPGVRNAADPGDRRGARAARPGNDARAADCGPRSRAVMR